MLIKALLIVVTLSSVGYADEITKSTGPSPISLEDKEHLSQVTVRALSARIIMLEALIESKGDIQHQRNYDTAIKAYNESVEALRKQYNAAGCTPDAITKEWKCGPVMATENKK